MTTRNVNEPWLTWGEVHVTVDSGCVVRLPHSADRLDIGLEIHHTEPGSDMNPRAGDVEIRAAWGRMLSIREQWEWHCDERELPVSTPMPDRWYPDEGIPCWVQCEPGAGDEIWICEWED